MKLYLLPVFIFSIISINSFAHSGGTDSNGCHAGSQPYHCHNGGDGDSTSSLELGAWDLNAGYQYHLKDSAFIPFIGASLGESEKNTSSEFGVNLGVKHQDGWYASYVTTSTSIQLGYSFMHLSVNSDYIGFGFRYPFNSNNNQSSVYYSASALFSSADSYTGP
jgi:hypothetical protein